MKPKNLIELKEQRPQLYKRLVNWGLQRKHSWGFNLGEFKTQRAKVENQIEIYLDELVFTPTKFSQAKDKLLYWGSILTDKEKQAVGLLIPYELPQSKISGATILHTSESLISNNWYDGLYKVLDEPVLDKLTYGSEDLGLITENSYGAVILNTDSMLIIDIDIRGDNHLDELAKYPEQAISALHILEEKDNLNFRIYETAGGLRAIETTKEWRPMSYNTKKVMTSVYADPLYVGLCWSQECFRARLTPKPWRLWGYNDYGFENGEEWMNYTGHSEVAVCKLITDGNKPIDDKFFAAINYHDKVTKALTAEQDDLCLV